VDEIRQVFGHPWPSVSERAFSERGVVFAPLGLGDDATSGDAGQHLIEWSRGFIGLVEPHLLKEKPLSCDQETSRLVIGQFLWNSR
jgi:hypothetical protein